MSILNIMRNNLKLWLGFVYRHDRSRKNFPTLPFLCFNSYFSTRIYLISASFEIDVIPRLCDRCSPCPSAEGSQVCNHLVCCDSALNTLSVLH